jgi:hypothetical protein
VTPRLGEILVTMGAATPAQVRAALENQVIFGGRLGTNLLELGLATEQAIADGLVRLHGCAALAGDRDIDPRVLSLLRADRVERLEVVPYRVDGRRLTVLALDPADLARADEVAFATGKQIRTIVVPQARLWALMQRHYGIARQLRGLSVSLGPAGAPRAADAPEPRPAPLPADLMGEEEFTAMYGEPPPGRPPLGAAPAPRPDDELPLPGLPAGPWVGSVAPPPPPPPAPLGGSLVSNAEVLAALQREASPGPDAPPPAEVPLLSPAEPPPLGFGEAIAALAGVDDRDAIARTVLRFARSRFRRAVLLTLHGTVAQGWEGAGDGLTSPAVARIRLRLDQPGIVTSVATTRAHFLGPLLRTEQNIQLLRALGRGAPKNAFAMPVLARGRPVNVLYADAGRGAHVDGGSVGELLILAAKISQSYEALIARAG